MNAEIRPFRKDVQKLAIFEDDYQDSDDESYYRKKNSRVRLLKRSIVRSSDTNEAPKVEDLVSNSNDLDEIDMPNSSHSGNEDF